MTGRVEGKKAFITGAAQGLGAEMARRLAAEGAKVSLGDLNLAGAQAVADEINAAHGAGTAFAFPLDVTREDQWIFALEEADAAMGGVSVLVNNAGIALGGHVEASSLEDFRRTMSVNVESVFLGAKYGLKYLRQNQPGSIVNISSIAGLIASHSTPSYNASKAAVWMLTKSIALHCAREAPNVRCNSVHPAFIDTPILDGLRERFGREALDAKMGRQIPLGHIGDAGDVADAVVYLASDESKFMTGAELKLDGGISAM